MGYDQHDFYEDKYVGKKSKYKELKKVKQTLRSKILSGGKAGFYRAIKLSAAIAERLPDRNDNIFTAGIKVAGIVQTVINSLDNKSYLEKLCSRYNAVLKNNKQFVNMFMTTGISDKFDVMNRDSIGENQWIIHLHNDDIGDFFFLECVSDGGNSFYRDVFFHTADLDFDEFANTLWEAHDYRIEVKNTETLFGTVYNYMTFPYPDPPAFGGAAEILSNMKQKHSKITGDDISRTYMFLGHPGVGKTTLALRFAMESGGKIIRLNANLMSYMSVKDLTFLLDVLKPNFIIVDDIDKADNYRAMPELLTLMEQIKQAYPKVCIILTANNTSIMEESLLRPGRVDTIVKFNDPDENDRFEIMNGYAKLYGIDEDEDTIKRISKSAKGMSGAWLKEAAIQLKYSSREDVETYVEEMVSFLAKTREEEDDEEEEDTPLVEKLTEEEEKEVVRETLFKMIGSSESITMKDFITTIEETSKKIIEQRDSKKDQAS